MKAIDSDDKQPYPYTVYRQGKFIRIEQDDGMQFNVIRIPIDKWKGTMRKIRDEIDT